MTTCPHCGAGNYRAAFKPGFPPPEKWLCGTVNDMRSSACYENEIVSLRTEILVVQKQHIDFLDTVEAMLKAAGWNGTLEHLNAKGKKPSDFIRALLDNAKELGQ